MKTDFQSSIPEIERIIGYSFRDKSLLRQAFTRASYCNEHTRGEKIQSNEVLEFFGDSVLSLTIVSFLLRECTERYAHGIRTELNEGDFSNIKSKLSDKTNLSRATRALGLQRFLLLGEGDEKLGVREEPSVMEDLFEAIVGAIYVDSGMNASAVMGAVSGMLNILEYLNAAPPAQSAKNALQEWCAVKSRRLPSPTYKTVAESGPDHKKVFERGVYIGEELIATGKGKNQKQADAVAAEAALMRLMEKEKAARRTEEQKKPRGEISTKKPAEDTSKTKTKAKAKPAVKTDKTKTAITPESALARELLANVQAAKPTANNKKPTASKRGAAKPPAVDEDAVLKLKDAALRGGRIPLSYRDMGADEGFSVECRFGERVAVGRGRTRAEARTAAASSILSSIESERGKKRSKKR